MSTVRFRGVPNSVRTVMVGIITVNGKEVIKYLIRAEIGGLYSVFESPDNGYSGRLLPRLNCNSDRECYHESHEQARKWIQEYENK